MPSIVHCIRHAQGEHNVVPGEASYLSHHDPKLTPLGETQARTLRSTFPHTPTLLVISPLRRTLQTALLGLAHPSIPTIINPDIQEADSWPCDTSHPSTHTLPEFVEAGFDFKGLPGDWNSKKGVWASTPEALTARAEKARRWLRSMAEEVVCVVSHMGFLRYLTMDGEDFGNAEWRSYRFVGKGEEGWGVARMMKIDGMGGGEKSKGGE